MNMCFATLNFSFGAAVEILDLFGLDDQPQIPSILHRAPVVQVAFQPDVPIPSEIRVEHVRELVKRGPAQSLP